MNKNNIVLSIVTIIAVFTSGITIYTHQSASATTESNDDPRLGIQQAQEALDRLNFPNASNETKANIEEGQEGLANITSMLNQLNGGSSSPLAGQSDSSSSKQEQQ